MLGVIAYLAVPGERRKRAATHFRRAGFEALKGVAALARPGAAETRRQPEREKIEVE